MLSPGQFHRLVPKDPAANTRYRKWLIEECRRNPALRAGVKAACKADVLFYINTFVFQYNPDNIGHEVEQFITYEFQEHAIIGADVEVDGVEVHLWGILECIEDQEDCRWPKSRKMGASWIALAVIDWMSLFHDHKTFGVLSRDEDSVDKAGDPNSLFWKIDFIHTYLPDWLKGEITKKKMTFLYHDTGSVIVGEANTVSAFVSGRATMLLIDEFGQFKNGEETFAMTSDVSYCRLFVFTHKEQAGMAYDLCFDTKYSGMREIKTHWSQHPCRNKGLYRYNEEANQVEILDKLFSYPEDFKFVYEAKPTGGPYPGLRSPWYDKECRRRSERDVAMNLDIDPRGATDKFFDPFRIHVLKNEFGRPPVWVGNLIYDAETGQPIELVEAPDGLIQLWIMPKSKTEMPVGRYGVGADIAAGTGATPSTMAGYNADTGHKVLQYSYALIFPNNFAELAVAMCRLLRDKDGMPALLGWELQGGNQFDRRVRELGYENPYVRADESARGKPRDTKGRCGVRTDSEYFLPLMGAYRAALYAKECVNHSEWALDETLRFVYTNRGVEYRGRTKPLKQAEAGSLATIHHGDIVTADVIGWKMVEELGVVAKGEVVEGIPEGSLAWRRMIRDNRRRQHAGSWL